MSKTAQRKRQAYEEGHRDASKGNGFKYSRHPFMEQYRGGFLAGSVAAEKITLLQWFREVFA